MQYFSTIFSYITEHNVQPSAILAATKQFAGQVSIRLVLPLTGGISKVLQKLLRCFNANIISTSFVPLIPVWLVIFCLILNEALLPRKLSIAQASVKMVNLYSFALNFDVFLNRYHHILLNYTYALLRQCL